MADERLTQSPAGEFIMFASGDGKVRIECRFESDTLWLSQAMICELYGKAKATISGHIKNIFEDGELVENSVVRFYRTTASDGKSYNAQYLNLPLILAIGYRIRSARGTQFRQWATQTLQEYLIKDFVMNDGNKRIYAGITMRLTRDWLSCAASDSARRQRLWSAEASTSVKRINALKDKGHYFSSIK
ncbi:virulence RhuM family protein [Kosakonia radicincitans YD4]|nr:virulence RhuM family protein [Kosakonia radicincitans YD4]